MHCRLCETRRPRRSCPGIDADICSVCCGTHREITIDCPLDCVYLQEAHQHEKLPALDPEQLPNRDVEVTERFVLDHEELVGATARSLVEAALEESGVVDADVREALGALIRTQRTRSSGLIYETRPSNPVAAGIQQRFREKMEQFEKQLRDRLGVATVRDADLLGALVFLQRVELAHNNGRKRGRAFIVFLRDRFPSLQAADSAALIVAP
jgi:hypothetical protein